MKRLLPLLFLLWAVKGFCQEVIIHGRVVDAETGEPLPYVNIRAGEGKATMTNIEGEYKFQATEEDILTFSLIGYDKKRIEADKMPSIVRLKPFTTMLQQTL